MYGKRLTLPEKWATPRFRKLHPNVKVLLYYILDTCDWGGFLEIDTEATSANVIQISGSTNQTANIVNIVDADALTTGSIMQLTSNSSSTGTRNLVYIVNDHASATGTTGLKIQQDSTGLALDCDGATDPRIRMTRADTTVVADEVLGSLQFASNDPSAGAVGASMQAKASSAWSSNNYGAYIRFLTTADDSGDQSERMRIDEDGNVGIGVTPTNGARLQLQGSSALNNTLHLGNYGVQGGRIASEGSLFINLNG